MKLSLFATAAVAAAFVAAPAFAQPTSPRRRPTTSSSTSARASSARRTSTAPTPAWAPARPTSTWKPACSPARPPATRSATASPSKWKASTPGTTAATTTSSPWSAPGSDANISTLGVLANARYEFNTGWNNVSPYVGAGVGYGSVNIDVDGLDDDQGGFMWQAKAGLVILDQRAAGLGHRLPLPGRSRSTTRAPRARP